ncbi:MAG TPA: 4-alpha-glucanotransferase [Gemmatimonadales bacterium]
MDELKALRTLATELGVHTRYTDGLGKKVTVGPETLLRVCAALGAPVTAVVDANKALHEYKARRGSGLPPVIVAWNGELGRKSGDVRLESGDAFPLDGRPLPMGYHRLSIGNETSTVLSAPVEAWRRPGSHRSWGVGTQLAALRSRRSRSVGDLRDLESLCRWLRERGGDLVTALPLLPTFNSNHPEPSPYSPVSRLFWSELMLDLEGAHQPVGDVTTLDVMRADAEVRAALKDAPIPDTARQDGELVRYAHFRGAQKRLGRNWRDWPAEARAGKLGLEHLDADEERFHLVAQTLVRKQLHQLRERLDPTGMRLGLDLAVGVHPDGYDPWSRQTLFCDGMSVGAPPDTGFPSGQDWGFAPVLPAASRLEGHHYLAASIGHQASLAGVLRVDHVMAWTRLYVIPHGMPLSEGTYVSYPAEELFAILTLESHRHHCEIVGENLGTVPPEIDEALPRHKIWGMYLAEFQDWKGKETKEGETPAPPAPPTERDMALIGTHDTPTFAGWLKGVDIGERVQYRLLAEEAVPVEYQARALQAEWIARRLNRPAGDTGALLDELLRWLGASPSPLVVPWLEDLWLEERAVNLPGTPSSQRPNWQRPMRLALDEIFATPEIEARIRTLERARRSG